MKRYPYESYRQYVRAQLDGYARKSDRVWTQRKHIKAIAGLLGPVRSGLCHGVRTGKEVSWFRKYTGAEVIGTEIAESKNARIIRWDFNVPRKEWFERFDFVYSNSFDHAFDFPATLQVWVDQLAPGGRLALEHGQNHQKLSVTDPTAIKRWQVKRFMRKCGLRNVREIPLRVWRDDKKKHRVVIIGDKPE